MKPMKSLRRALIDRKREQKKQREKIKKKHSLSRVISGKNSGSN